MFLQEQTTVLKCPDQPGPVQTPNAAPSFLSTHLRNVTRLDSPASPLHCPALHNQSRIPASPGLHSRVHSPSISNMAALRYVHKWKKNMLFLWYCTPYMQICFFGFSCVTSVGLTPLASPCPLSLELSDLTCHATPRPRAATASWPLPTAPWTRRLCCRRWSPFSQTSALSSCGQKPAPSPGALSFDEPRAWGYCWCLSWSQCCVHVAGRKAARPLKSSSPLTCVRTGTCAS